MTVALPELLYLVLFKFSRKCGKRLRCSNSGPIRRYIRPVVTNNDYLLQYRFFHVVCRT